MRALCKVLALPGLRLWGFAVTAAVTAAAAVVAMAAITAAATATAAAAPVTIAALGDSLTQGYGLPPQDGFVPQLERWLRAAGAEEVTIVNAGVSGDTSAGGAARVEWTLAGGVDGLIVALGGNDLLRGIDPATTRANLEAILAAADAAGVPVLLIGMRAPDNFGADYKAAFDSIYPELAAAHGALFVAGFLDGIAGPEAAPADLLPWLQPDGIHPNAEGVARIVAAVGPKVLELARLAERARRD